jgi:hypothetical protein
MNKRENMLQNWQKEETYYDKEIQSSQNENYKKKYRKFYDKVDYLTRRNKPRDRNTKTQYGTMLTEECRIIDTLKKYFQRDQ